MSHSLRRGLVFAAFCLGAAADLPLLSRADDDAPVGGRRFALLVGVRDYDPEQFRSLSYTENDAKDLAQVLRDAGYRRVVLLTQSEAAGQHNVRLQPTGKNIRAQLTALLEECKPDDSVLVALSGHGVQPHGQKGSYFCPMDADVKDLTTLVPVTDIYKDLADCKAGVKVLLVDACRNDPLAGGDKGLPKLKVESVTRPREEGPPSGVAALFACSEGEQAYESKHFEHGIFFHFVLEGLKGEAANKEGSVTLQRLVGYVKDEAPLQAKDEIGPDALQHPELLGNLNLTGAAPLVTAVLKDEITNTIGMKLKLIKPGTFTMGSPKDEAGRYDDEGPQHEVEITKAFYMGVCPVTKGQFAAFVKDDGYSTEAEMGNHKDTWRTPNFLSKYDQTDIDPVAEVSWNDAVKFCQWLTKTEGKTYELPTEAEWEYSYRAGTKTAFFFGADPTRLDDYAWYSGNAGSHTHPVGGKKPNPWGLYDMSGNVWQWCADGYDQYQEGSIKDPNGKESANRRVLRGGSWLGVPRLCRSAFRNNYDRADRSGCFGFRVVLRPSARTP